MRFIVSDHIEGSHGFGKWKYSHDNDVHTWTDGDRLCLWFGYSIEQNLEEIIQENNIADANGKFCVVMLWKDKMEVYTDYFSQSKIYYNTKDGITVTNHLASLPLTEQDIDKTTIDKFAQGWEDGAPLYACKDPMNMKYIYDWNAFSSDRTLFADTSSIPRDHMLLHDHKGTQLIQINNTYLHNLESFNHRLDWNSTQLEDRIHECMEQHSKVIKNEYDYICSSISEGIDSTLQDQYFNANVRLMYHPEEPNTSEELGPKEDILKQYHTRQKHFLFEIFDVKDIGAITTDFALDPMLSYLDTMPTIWQVRSLKRKPDILLYGQCADEMFMHIPKFLMARVPPQHREKYKNSYGGRKSPARPYKDPYNGQWHKDWQERFATMAVPALYNRDVENQTGVLTTSLYADRRIFNLVHQMTASIQLDSMANVTPQRNILQNHFAFPFHTKLKDGAGYECRLVLKHLLTDTLPKIIST